MPMKRWGMADFNYQELFSYLSQTHIFLALPRINVWKEIGTNYSTWSLRGSSHQSVQHSSDNRESLKQWHVGICIESVAIPFRKPLEFQASPNLFFRQGPCLSLAAGAIVLSKSMLPEPMTVSIAPNFMYLHGTYHLRFFCMLLNRSNQPRSCASGLNAKRQRNHLGTHI